MRLVPSTVAIIFYCNKHEDADVHIGAYMWYDCGRDLKRCHRQNNSVTRAASTVELADTNLTHFPQVRVVSVHVCALTNTPSSLQQVAGFTAGVKSHEEAILSQTFQFNREFGFILNINRVA